MKKSHERLTFRQVFYPTQWRHIQTELNFVLKGSDLKAVYISNDTVYLLTVPLN